MELKNFTLNAPDPCRNSQTVTFAGIEYPTLREASEATTKFHGLYIALEILGRAFVLSILEARRFAQEDIPYTLGFGDGEEFASLPGNVSGRTSWLNWASDEGDKISLAEFINNGCPLTDEDFSGDPMFRLYDHFMAEAMHAFCRARKANNKSEFQTAYRESLHSYGCWSAAHAAIDEDREYLGFPAATRAYNAAINKVRLDHPHLDNVYFS